MTITTHDRVARIEKLAGEAEKIGDKLISNFLVIRWAADNGRELSTLLHDLAKRIKAEEEGSL